MDVRWRSNGTLHVFGEQAPWKNVLNKHARVLSQRLAIESVSKRTLNVLPPPQIMWSLLRFCPLQTVTRLEESYQRFDRNNMHLRGVKAS